MVLSSITWYIWARSRLVRGASAREWSRCTFRSKEELSNCFQSSRKLWAAASLAPTTTRRQRSGIMHIPRTVLALTSTLKPAEGPVSICHGSITYTRLPPHAIVRSSLGHGAPQRARKPPVLHFLHHRES